MKLAAEYPVQLVSMGLMDIMMGVDGAEHLASLTPDFPAITALSKEKNCVRLGYAGEAISNMAVGGTGEVVKKVKIYT
ncbi:hypothetical protein RFF05_17265 [Bengtsoniella intestinalis]|uniref:hypothetical protein n=1 Tax=Bengtsoniella intestinalis TaxID=3073143 RepID=UPI00391F6A73